MEKQKEEIPRTMRTIEGGAARTEAPGRGTSWGVVGLGSGAVSMQLGRRIFSPTPSAPVSLLLSPDLQQFGAEKGAGR